MLRRFAFTFLAFSIAVAAIAAPRTTDAAEIQLALKKLTVVGAALQVAAHPDDENTALNAYLANDRLYRTAYLSVTRGEKVVQNIDLVKDLCETLRDGSLCALGGLTPMPVMSALEHFPEDFDRKPSRVAAE